MWTFPRISYADEEALSIFVSTLDSITDLTSSKLWIRQRDGLICNTAKSFCSLYGT